MYAIDDLKYSVRLLRKAPSFTALTLLIIVLGLSLYLTSYTVEQILTDKPMPFPDGERYVSLKTMYEPSGGEGGLSNHNGFSYSYIKENSESFATLNAYRETSYVLSDGSYASTFRAAEVEWEILKNAEVFPILGRLFAGSDSDAGAEPVAIISETIWKDYYNADPEIIGRVARLNGELATIIGVLPQNYQFPVFEELWVPLSAQTPTEPEGGTPFTADTPLALVGILNDDISIEAASNELNVLMEQMTAAYPDAFSGRIEYAAPFVSLNQDRGFNFGPILSFVTLIILALAVINLSSLLVIRARARQHELAVRSSVGASGLELAKQVLLESFLICLSGFVLSLALSALLIALLNTLFVNSMGLLPFWFEMSLEFETIVHGGLYATGVWLISGIPIAYRVYRSQTAMILNGSNKGGQNKESSILTKTIVGTEVVLSFFLLVCCGVMLYFADRLTNADYGVETSSKMVASFSLNNPAYQTRDARINYTRSLIQRASNIPEVITTVITTAPPGYPGSSITYELDDRDLRVADQLPPARSIWVSDEYFNRLGIELLSGREFSDDLDDSAPVTVITNELAQLLWPNESPIGKRIGSSIGGGETEWLNIIGIVSRVQQSPFNLGNVPPSIYRPISQSTPTDYYMISQFKPGTIVANLEKELRLASGEIDRNIAVDSFQVLDIGIKLNQSGLDVLKQIFVLFSLATFVLAGVGIYSVISRSIALQTSEVGIRRALGSSHIRILIRYLKQGAVFLFVGTVLGGVAATLAVSGILSSFPFPISISLLQFFPAIVLGVFLSMGLLIFYASYMPARRTIQLEPGDALRYE